MAKSKRRRPRPRQTSAAAAVKRQQKPEPPPDSEPPAGRRLLGLLVPVLIGAGALAVYIATLAPSVPTGDSGELISAAYVGGVAHPPGYPLYTMIGWVATHLSPWAPAVTMNLLSALFHATAVGLIALLTARLVEPGWPASSDRGRSALAGAAAGGVLAVSTGFWSYALVAEVFALNDLFAVALLLLAIEWFRDRSKGWALLGIGLLSGLGAAHHQTIVLLGPALALLLYVGYREDQKGTRSRRARDRRKPEIEPWHFPSAIALIGAGLLAYIYLPISAATDPAVNFGDPETGARFIDVVTRGPYGSFSLIPGGERGAFLDNFEFYGSYLWTAFTPVGILLAIGGLAALWRRFRTEAIALGLAFLFTGPSFVLVASSTLATPLTRGIVERFFILSSVVVAVFIGVGVHAVVGWLASLERVGGKVAVAMGAVGVIALVGLTSSYRWSSVDQSDNHVAEQYGRDLLADLEPDSLLLVRGDHNYTSLIYAQEVDGIRSDVALLEMELIKLPAYVTEFRQRHPDIAIPFDHFIEDSTGLVDLIEANLDDRPVYVAGPMEVEVADAVTEVRAGLVRRLRPLGSVDEFSLLLAEPERVTDLHYPASLYPDTTWEALISQTYGNGAHSLAFALHETEPTEFDPLVEEFYKKSIRYGSPDEAYKNLGLFYFERDGDPDVIIDLWETYLAFDTEDPNAAAMQNVIDNLRSGG